jgi:hypothetical protein
VISAAALDLQRKSLTLVMVSSMSVRLVRLG